MAELSDEHRGVGRLLQRELQQQGGVRAGQLSRSSGLDVFEGCEDVLVFVCELADGCLEVFGPGEELPVVSVHHELAG